MSQTSSNFALPSVPHTPPSNERWSFPLLVTALITLLLTYYRLHGTATGVLFAASCVLILLVYNFSLPLAQCVQRYLSIHSDLRLPPGRREAEIVHRGYHAGVRDGLAVVREQETRRWAAMRHDDDGEYDALEEQQIEEEEMEEEEEEDYFLRSTDRGYQRPTRSTRGANGKSMGSAGGGRREGQGANRQKNPRSGTGIARSNVGRPRSSGYSMDGQESPPSGYDQWEEKDRERKDQNKDKDKKKEKEKEKEKEKVKSDKIQESSGKNTQQSSKNGILPHVKEEVHEQKKKGWMG